MLKRLRIKFIVLIMGIVAVLLGSAFTIICVMDWQQSVADTDMALEAAIQQAVGSPSANAGGAVPLGQKGTFDPAASDPSTPDPADMALDHTPTGDREGDSGDGRENDPADMRSIYPAMKGGRFAARPIPDLFTAVYEQEGDQFTFLPESSSAMWVPEVVGDYADELRAHADGTGMLGSTIYYMKRTLPEGCYVAMVYAGQMETWKGLAVNLALVGAIVLAVFLVISIVFSRWALRPVEAAWTQQRRFVADASHDLKTPLTVVLANTSILLDEPDQTPAERRKWLESTRDEAQGMQALVEDMLRTLGPTPDAGTEAGAASGTAVPSGANASASHPASDLPAAHQPPAADAAADLSHIAAKEMLQFESIAFERHLTLESTIHPDVRVPATAADARRLVQALLDNACKYANEGGRVDLTLALDAPAATARLEVNNTGPGISEADLPHIFDRFYRADQARTSHEGHGLGLAIARSITERAGGTITATSKNGTTTLTVTLPVA